MREKVPDSFSTAFIGGYLAFDVVCDLSHATGFVKAYCGWPGKYSNDDQSLFFACLAALIASYNYVGARTSIKRHLLH